MADDKQGATETTAGTASTAASTAAGTVAASASGASGVGASGENASGAAPATPAAGAATPVAATLTGEPAKAETKAEAPVAPTAPIAYDLKFPDGSPADAALLERTVADAQALGLSPEQAQKVLEASVRERTQAAESAVTAAFAAHQPGGAEWAKQEAAWRASALADAEIGGTPEQLAASVALAKQGLSKFATPEFLAALDKSGFGSNPEVVRVFARIGRASREGTVVPPTAEAASTRSVADLFYGSTNGKSKQEAGATA